MYPEEIDKWSNMDLDFTFPGGEKMGSFFERTAQVGDYISSLPDKHIVVMTHGGMVRSLICHYLGLDWKNYILFEISDTSLTTIKLFGNKGILAGMNDTCHLNETHECDLIQNPI